MTERDSVAAPFAATTFYAGPASLAGPASARLTADAMLTTEGNRWSAPGEPTIYLAGDPGVALAELGRHAPADPEASRVWSVRVELDRVVDLRTDRDSARLFDRAHCRTLATRLRTADACEGILVPSVAMLDRPDRWNLVVFTDRLRRPLSNAVRPDDAVADVTPATVAGAARGR
jgi:RES domain-containing protein